MKKNHHGFTLMELLVCIVIVAILAAILIPTAYTIREKAMRTNCANNLRQINVALKLYAAENNGEYPTRARDAHLQKITWAEMSKLHQYAGESKNVFYCPAAIDNGYGPDDSPSGYKNWRESATWVNLGYLNMWNRQIYRNPENPSDWDRATALSLHSPGYTLVACDMVYNPIGGSEILTNHSTGDNMPAGANVLTNDGSVRWVEFDPGHFITFSSSPFLIPDKESRH